VRIDRPAGVDVSRVKRSVHRFVVVADRTAAACVPSWRSPFYAYLLSAPARLGPAADPPVAGRKARHTDVTRYVDVVDRSA